MLITCPDCGAQYDVDEKIIPDWGKKMRCAKCNKVWLAEKKNKGSEFENPKSDFGDEEIESVGDEVVETPSVAVDELKPEETLVDDVVEEKPEIVADEEPKIVPDVAEVVVGAVVEENDDMKDVMSRLSSQTEEIFKKDKERPIKDKLVESAARKLGLRKKTTRYAFLAVFVTIFCLFMVKARYDVVKVAPFMKGVYDAMGMKSVIPGEGLEFFNITRREYEEDYVGKLEIKGFIVNNTENKIDVPDIRVELLDKDTNLLQSVDSYPNLRSLHPEDRMGFAVVIDKPSNLTKYVMVTFVQEENLEESE